MIQKADNERKGFPTVSRRSVRSAFTLLELLIVLAVIIMIMSIATPSVTQMLDKAKFRDGVLELQAELGRTRLLAMKTGVPIIFRYQNGTGLYQVFPKSYLEKEDGIGAANSANALKNLPEDALFFGGMTIESDDFQHSMINAQDGAESRSEWLGSLNSNDGSNPSPSSPSDPFPKSNPFSSAENSSFGGWSKPILFYPNGRTSTAVIFLRSLPKRGKNDYYSEISFRGMTGAARVSSISTSPPGSPEFPSVLSEEAFARWRQGDKSHFAAGGGLR